MLWIKSVEIRYFRSVYRARLTSLSHVNILSGKNDAGKSNVLKALHLFFNNQTDWGSEPDFRSDFTYQRLEEVRRESVKGKQFISVKVEFQRPDSYSQSLPESFIVTRTWFRDLERVETDNLESLVRQGKLASEKLTTARRFLSMFLNRIHFEYVPAVKDRRYHQDLLGRLQQSILQLSIGEDSDLSSIAGSLASHIGENIQGLQQDFRSATGLESRVQPPQQLGALFRAFAVTTGPDDGMQIPLVLRGDGIQSIYILSVLQYIACASHKFFIVALEEPENSLEYSREIEVANRIEQDYARVAQVFLTTHSPALTCRKSTSSTCHRVFLDSKGLSQIALVHPQKGNSAQRDALNQELGYLRIQEGLHEEYVRLVRESESFSSRLRSIQAELHQTQMPMVVTEGKHDCTILRIAWDKLHPTQSCPFVFESANPSGSSDAGGQGGASLVAKVIEAVIPLNYPRRVLGLFDHDTIGEAQFSRLSSSFRSMNSEMGLKAHRNGKALAMLLPTPLGREAYALKKTLVLEFYFPDDALSMTTADGRGLRLSTPSSFLYCGDFRMPLHAESLAALGADFWDGLKHVDGGKDTFADEVVPSLDASAFSNFEPLLNSFARLLLQP